MLVAVSLHTCANWCTQLCWHATLGSIPAMMHNAGVSSLRNACCICQHAVLDNKACYVHVPSSCIVCKTQTPAVHASNACITIIPQGSPLTGFCVPAYPTAHFRTQSTSLVVALVSPHFFPPCPVVDPEGAAASVLIGTCCNDAPAGHPMQCDIPACQLFIGRCSCI